MNSFVNVAQITVCDMFQSTADVCSDYRQYRVEISPQVNFKVKYRDSVYHLLSSVAVFILLSVQSSRPTALRMADGREYHFEGFSVASSVPLDQVCCEIQY